MVPVWLTIQLCIFGFLIACTIPYLLAYVSNKVYKERAQDFIRTHVPPELSEPQCDSSAMTSTGGQRKTLMPRPSHLVTAMQKTTQRSERRDYLLTNEVSYSASDSSHTSTKRARTDRKQAQSARKVRPSSASSDQETSVPIGHMRSSNSSSEDEDDYDSSSINYIKAYRDHITKTRSILAADEDEPSEAMTRVIDVTHIDTNATLPTTTTTPITTKTIEQPAKKGGVLHL